MPGWPARSTTSSFVGSTAIPPAPGGWSSIRELVEELFAGEEAWIVGGAVRDAALERPIVDVDVALAEPPFDFRRVPETRQRIRRGSGLVTDPSKERILAELQRLSADGFRRLEELGLLESLGGSLTSIERAGVAGYPHYDLVVVFGENLLKLPISNETRRFARTLLRAEPPANDSSRAIHRFRRATEPWALEALTFLGARGFDDAVIRAREAEPNKPLVRGGELDLPPGPEVGRLLEEIAEERAAGTITTKEEALDYARRNSGSGRSDG